MRLWHYKLIPYLPNSQLIDQWRELNSIFKKQDNHILINYVYEHPKENLAIYTFLVVEEMEKRKINIKSFENMNNYFGFVLFSKGRGGIHSINPFPNHHNNRYLWQCFANLQEKYDRGQKDFSDELYEKLEMFMQEQGVPTII